MDVTSIELRSISKSFGSSKVLDEVTLTIPSGSFFLLLGPSGCGKSTLLRVIAGLTAPDTGKVMFDGADITSAEPQRRGVNMVFQSYALWPHLSVRENVAFGLDVRGEPSADRVTEMLDLVRMEGYGDRYPHELSGGQQQRIALARALAPRPRVVLLDEPLSNLDAKLRMELRRELRAIHRALGSTFVFVTHDQEEAAALATEVALMRAGAIEHHGTPSSIYLAPKNDWVREFVGSATLLSAVVGDDGTSLRFGAEEIGGCVFQRSRPGDTVKVLMRPEQIVVIEEPAQ